MQEAVGDWAMMPGTNTDHPVYVVDGDNSVKSFK